MADNQRDPGEQDIASTGSVERGYDGKIVLTTTRIRMFGDSTATQVAGNATGVLGFIVGAAVKAATGMKEHGPGVPLATIKSVTAQPEKKGAGPLVLTFKNGKTATFPKVFDVEAFAAKVNEQLAKLPATAPAAPAAAPAPPATRAAPGTVVTFDARVKTLPGWQSLQQWVPACLDGNPTDVRLAIDAPGTAEALFLRTKEEFGDCAVRLVYRLAPMPPFAYLGLRVRSDGKSYGLVRINNKGEYFVGGTPPQGAHPWTKAAHLVPDQPTEVLITMTGGTLRLSLGGTEVIAKDGLHGPVGRIVLVAGANPKPAELGLAAFEVRAG